MSLKNNKVTKRRQSRSRRKNTTNNLQIVNHTHERHDDIAFYNTKLDVSHLNDFNDLAIATSVFVARGSRTGRAT